jgi:uncharacterized coiled-coil DUF342 family protein
MQTMEISSTDKRIDDLNNRTSEGFGRVAGEINRLDGDIRELRGDIKGLRGETNEGFTTQRRETNESFATQKRETNEGFARVDAYLISINARFDAMHRTMMRGFFAIGTINVTVFVAFAGLHGF